MLATSPPVAQKLERPPTGVHLFFFINDGNVNTRLLENDICKVEIRVLMLIKTVACRYIMIPANRGKGNKELGMALLFPKSFRGKFQVTV